MAEDKILSAIEDLGKGFESKQAESKKQIDEAKASFDKQIAEAKTALTESEKKHAEDLKNLTEDLTKKGATIAEMVEKVKKLEAKGGRMGDNSDVKTAKNMIAEAFEKHFDEIKSITKKHGVSIDIEGIKAVTNMTAANNLTGNVVATYDLQPAVRGRRKINLRDLIPVIASATGSWKFYRENSPAPADGSFTQQTTHGNAKSQIDYGLTEVTVTADYIAAFVRFAKQMAQDLPFLQTFVANELIEDYKRSESGIFLPTLTAAATAGGPLTSATVVAEKYIDWIGYLYSIDYEPSAILTDYTNWASVLKTKPQNYSLPGAVEIAPGGQVMFAGLPLIPQNNMATGKTLVGDFSKAAIIQTEGMSVNFYEQDSDNVQRNLITAKAEARVGLGILRTDAFVYA